MILCLIDHQSIPMSARVPPFQCHVMITANNALFNVTDSIGGTIMAYVIHTYMATYQPIKPIISSAWIGC